MYKTRNKKATSLFIVLVFIAFLAIPQSSAFHHAGTASDPLPISCVEDLDKIAECVRVNKNWSDGKYLSLNCNIELKTDVSLSGSDENHAFNGTFHGNGHIVTLIGNHPLFCVIGKDGTVDNLQVRGDGMIADDNRGNISNCTSYVTATYGIARNNNGSIAKCSVLGELSSAGVVGSNSGYIFQCHVEGNIKGYDRDLAGIANYNTKKGSIVGCTVNANFELTTSRGTRYSPAYHYTAQHVNRNEGELKNCG